MLIGAGLCVVVPEGFVAYFHSHGQPDSHSHGAGHAAPEWLPGAALMLGFNAMLALDVASHSYSKHEHGEAQYSGANGCGLPPQSDVNNHRQRKQQEAPEPSGQEAAGRRKGGSGRETASKLLQFGMWKLSLITNKAMPWRDEFRKSSVLPGVKK